MHIKLIQDAIDVCRHKKKLPFWNNLKWKIKRYKKNFFNEKINLVFVCHRPNVWGSLKTVFEACCNDKDFQVTVVAIPNKKQLPVRGLNHQIYETEGAEDFCKNFPCRVINGYDYHTHQWFNLKQLHPDFVFLQQPYNACRSPLYQSSAITKYARILYVHYAANFIGNGVLEESYPADFIRDVDTIFLQDYQDAKLVKQYLERIGAGAKTFLTGFPRYDGLEKLKNIDSAVWNLPKSEQVKRIIWTPRWSTNEGNCHFFDYKDKLLSYVEQQKDIDFIFRPHPQAFLEWNATGELPEAQAREYKKRYENCPHAKIDTQKEYLTTFYSSDVLITDVSSIVAEYFLTGKPVIYCHKKDCFNDFSRALSKGFYWVRNWDELQKTIEMLKAGQDPLHDVRQEIIKENFYINPQGAGHTIKELIKKDFYGK